jgi:uncharacterized protein (TIGR03067 family)
MRVATVDLSKRRKATGGLDATPTAAWLVALLAFAIPSAVTAAEPFPAASQTDPEAADRERYAGTWRVTSIEANGEVSPQDDRVILVENAADGTWTLTVDGREVNRGTSSIDPFAMPKEIDLEITAGDGSGGILKGIYEVGEKDRRLCFRGGNEWRPREFSGAAGSRSVLVVFERQ